MNKWFLKSERSAHQGYFIRVLPDYLKLKSRNLKK